MWYYDMFLAQEGLIRSPFSVIWIAILILDILVVVSLLVGKGTAMHKTLCSLVVLVLPVVGVVLYFVCGSNSHHRPLL